MTTLVRVKNKCHIWKVGRFWWCTKDDGVKTVIQKGTSPNDAYNCWYLTRAAIG